MYPITTPEGDTITPFACFELGMGGPMFGDYLFPDGVVLQGIYPGRFSDGGRWFFAGLPPSDERGGRLLFDRQRRRIYSGPGLANIRAILDTGPGEAEAYVGGTYPDFDWTPLAGWLAQCEAVDLVAVRDLWLLPDLARDTLAFTAQLRDFPAPSGGHSLRGLPWLPERLRDLPHPLAPLQTPTWQLEADGEISDLLLAADEKPTWDANGQGLVCRATPLHAERFYPQALWRWQAGQGWRVLGEG
ncbi:MAG: hypothetical protein QM586_00380 [Xenophilus sp.]